MDEFYIPDDSEIPGINQRAFASYFESRSRSGSRLIDEAREVIIGTIRAAEGEELRQFFSKLSGKIDAELWHNTPNLDVCRIWTTALRLYRRAARSLGGCHDNSLKGTLVTQLERELSQQMDKKDIFVFSVLQELYYGEMDEAVTPKPGHPSSE